MQASPTDVTETIRSFAARLGKTTDPFGPDTPLYREGIGFDSLETAELSAILEDQHGRDPFSEGLQPLTIGDVLAFYR